VRPVLPTEIESQQLTLFLCISFTFYIATVLRILLWISGLMKVLQTEYRLNKIYSF